MSDPLYAIVVVVGLLQVDTFVDTRGPYADQTVCIDRANVMVHDIMDKFPGAMHYGAFCGPKEGLVLQFGSMDPDLTLETFEKLERKKDAPPPKPLPVLPYPCKEDDNLSNLHRGCEVIQA